MNRKIILSVCVLALQLMHMAAYASDTKPSSHLKIYMAASLFNERETSFNLELAKNLERKGYQVILPQRDGFEYVALTNQIDRHVQHGARALAANTIYLLDMGKYIPESDVVVANLDQPIDEGVVVEITYAHLIGKPVVGVRTDLRSPYNGDQELFGGVHSFVSYQTNAIAMQHQVIRNSEDEQLALNNLTNTIIQKIGMIQPQKSKKLPSYVLSNPNVANLIEASNLLFTDIADIHSEDGIKEVVSRVVRNQSKLAALNIGLKFG